MKKKSRSKLSTNKHGVLKRKGADRHLLYQWTVQNPEFELDFFDHVYRKRRRRRPRILREDFCGTALLSSAWAASRRDRRAIGIDLDSGTLAWGRKHNLARLDGAADRVTLLRQDVRTLTKPKADVACAYNFSYYLIHPYADLVDYFAFVRRSLKKDGMFFLDAYGGWESQQRMEESREIDGPAGRFVYIWDQAAFNPIDNMATCHIHFEFAGGKRLKRAFTYRWRVYSPVEVRDALLGAGFTAVDIYWDRSPDDDTNDYRVAKRATNTPGWLAYIVGVK
jgi:SAM-dependent methyltransferase